jgi:hypothetical protein
MGATFDFVEAGKYKPFPCVPIPGGAGFQVGWYSLAVDFMPHYDDGSVAPGFPARVLIGSPSGWRLVDGTTSRLDKTKEDPHNPGWFWDPWLGVFTPDAAHVWIPYGRRAGTSFHPYAPDGTGGDELMSVINHAAPGPAVPGTPPQKVPSNAALTLGVLLEYRHLT